MIYVLVSSILLCCSTQFKTRVKPQNICANYLVLRPRWRVWKLSFKLPLKHANWIFMDVFKWKFTRSRRDKCVYFHKKTQQSHNYVTPRNLRVCAWWKVPAKHFKICNISYVEIDQWPAFIREKNKVVQNEKWKKQLWV